ncbi:endonuclease/exonuclease/phosphatase family protein [Actinomycetospora lemnae]|uniref:Endonuclease/exonuclease/phosphatase family protein n=1 Tax=Actinomycetospora lemnae TaxID=3019891 RepID=A0ABT5SS99_9PSEU|nr:endonuclease/exonuclease/phosphatase family protein [Actinomycetospora sp. DW7H6]MDD7965041.1 endonuclease/exonuclease/phosphatase family protein [Actinomycetospora sp. DW7H6]
MARLVTALLGVAAAVVAAWVPFWWWAPTGSAAAFALLALTPIVAALAVVVAVLAGVLRRWVPAVVALVAAVVLAVVVVPRALGDDDPAVPPGRPGSATVTVASVNLQFGRADPASVVALVREHRVDVLGLTELTPASERALAAAGLTAELPFVSSRARRGAGGTALLARQPLAPSGIVLREGVFAQVEGRLLAPGGPVDVVVAHPAAPVFRDDPEGWAREIAELPAPASSGEPPRLIVGDLNATLDHRPLRTLLAGPWEDAADAVGAGLRGTWPTDRAVPPFAAIDHVLVSGPASPVDVLTREPPGTDHAGLVVTLAVDGGRTGVTPAP